MQNRPPGDTPPNPSDTFHLLELLLGAELVAVAALALAAVRRTRGETSLGECQ